MLLELAGVADVDEDGLLPLHEFQHLRCVEQGVLVGIVGNVAELPRLAGLGKDQGVAFGSPLLVATDQEAAGIPFPGELVTQLGAAVAVEAEQDRFAALRDQLRGIAAQVGIADIQGALEPPHLDFLRLPRIDEVEGTTFRHPALEVFGRDSGRVLDLGAVWKLPEVHVDDRSPLFEGGTHEIGLEALVLLVEVTGVLQQVRGKRDTEKAEADPEDPSPPAAHPAGCHAGPAAGRVGEAAESDREETEHLSGAGEEVDDEIGRRNGPQR